MVSTRSVPSIHDLTFSTYFFVIAQGFKLIFSTGNNKKSEKFSKVSGCGIKAAPGNRKGRFEAAISIGWKQATYL